LDILDTSQKSNYQKMVDGDPYTAIDESLFALGAVAQRRTAEYLALPEDDFEGRVNKLREMVGEMGEMAVIVPPVHFDYGVHVRLGDQVYVNTGAVFLDSACISIGDRTLVGPRVQFITAGHPVKPEERIIQTPGAPWLPFRAAALPGRSRLALTAGSGPESLSFPA
jgi:maltose O-acetyltransferase